MELIISASSKALGVLLICISVSMIGLPPGPFRKPHSIFWKICFAIVLAYTLLAAALVSLQVSNNICIIVAI